MKWYVKLSLVFGGMALLIVSFIAYDQSISGKIIVKTLAKGARGERQVFKFKIEDYKSSYTLIIHPSIRSGWGDPDVFIEATLADPQNNNLITIGRETVFGGIKPTPSYMRSYSDYEKRYTFRPTHAGEYTLRLTVLTDHVKDVYIEVSQKEK